MKFLAALIATASAASTNQWSEDLELYADGWYDDDYYVHGDDPTYYDDDFVY